MGIGYNQERAAILYKISIVGARLVFGRLNVTWVLKMNAEAALNQQTDMVIALFVHLHNNFLAFLVHFKILLCLARGYLLKIFSAVFDSSFVKHVFISTDWNKTTDSNSGTGDMTGMLGILGRSWILGTLGMLGINGSNRMLGILGMLGSMEVTEC